jgi:DNA (cytosine-5)-methyltransferase 1
MKKVLNLCAGVGGNSKFWDNCEVTAVEKNPKIAAIYKKLYPHHTVIVGCAYEYLKENFANFDFIWISPPCQKHSKMMKATRHKVADYPDFKLYEVIVFLTHFFKGKWVVENVKPYYPVPQLYPPTAIIDRHLFWSNFAISDFQLPPKPKNFIQNSSLKGRKELLNWLGMEIEDVVYYEGNHCPCQILRNCVHPLLGLHVFSLS